MLHKVLGDHQAAGGKPRQASGHSGVDDPIHTVLQAQDLCRHGGIHLADTAGAGNDPRCSLVERHTGHGLKCLQLLGPRQGMKLCRHGKLQSNFHYITLLFYRLIRLSPNTGPCSRRVFLRKPQIQKQETKTFKSKKKRNSSKSLNS